MHPVPSTKIDKNVPIRVKAARYNKNTNLAFMELQYLVLAEFISFLDVCLHWKQEFSIDLI